MRFNIFKYQIINGFMSILNIVLIGFSLSFDAFAVSVTDGINNKFLKFNRILLLGVIFGLFQAVMPIIGYFAGLSVKSYVQNWDHWLAFGLLSALGLKIIYESLLKKEENECKEVANFSMLMLLGIATSIDALVVGITMPFICSSFLMPSIIIGIITFFMSMFGVKLGNICGNRINLNCELIGGIILCGIGLKILLEHVLK